MENSLESESEAEFEPRGALPMSDAELEDIYRQVIRKKAGVTLSDRFKRDYKLKDAVFADVSIWCVFFLVLTAWREFLPPMLDFTLVVGLTTLTCYALLVNDIAVGYFSAKRMRDIPSPDSIPVDVHSPEVLQVVVKQIVSGPTQFSVDLQRKIQADRALIASSIAEMDRVQIALKDEMSLADTDSLRLLYSSRRDTATDLGRQLRELDAKLAAQVRDAAEALKPVNEMVEKFHRLARISSSLSRIQTAHQLVESTNDKVLDHRMELQILRNAAFDAQYRLVEIKEQVLAQERARDELGL